MSLRSRTTAPQFAHMNFKGLILILGLFGLFNLTPAWAGTANYYYDATGRLMATFRTTGDWQEYSYDSADNRNYEAGTDLGLPYQAYGVQAYTTLFQNQSISSPDGRFLLAFSGDGNLVLYEGSTPL